jgi:hypothetical protein
MLLSTKRYNSLYNAAADRMVQLFPACCCCNQHASAVASTLPLLPVFRYCRQRTNVTEFYFMVVR